MAVGALIKVNAKGAKLSLAPFYLYSNVKNNLVLKSVYKGVLRYMLQVRLP